MNEQTHNRAAAVNAQLESPLGKLSWTLAKTVITLLITTLATLSTTYLASMSKRYDEQAAQNTRQDLTLQSLQQLTQSQQKVQDAQAATLNQMSQQVLHNTDSIEHLKDVQLQIIQRGRPQ